MQVAHCSSESVLYSAFDSVLGFVEDLRIGIAFLWWVWHACCGSKGNTGQHCLGERNADSFESRTLIPIAHNGMRFMERDSILMLDFATCVWEKKELALKIGGSGDQGLPVAADALNTGEIAQWELVEDVFKDLIRLEHLGCRGQRHLRDCRF